LDFWAIFWEFGVDGMIFGCYKSVGEVFWGCNGLKIKFSDQKRRCPDFSVTIIEGGI